MEGEVYGAKHPVIGKRVAVKVMNRLCSANPLNVDRFVTEAKAVNAIGHSNIVDIFSFGRTEDGRCYFVMEWLIGESLRDRMDRQPLELPHALDVLDAVLRALEAAHATGIVHRDLKPDNIFLVAPRDPEPERVKLLDFGIAKLVDDGAEVAATVPRSHRTSTGTVVGTPAYMAPEQAAGLPVKGPADVYSLSPSSRSRLSRHRSAAIRRRDRGADHGQARRSPGAAARLDRDRAAGARCAAARDAGQAAGGAAGAGGGAPRTAQGAATAAVGDARPRPRTPAAGDACCGNGDPDPYQPSSRSAAQDAAAGGGGVQRAVVAAVVRARAAASYRGSAGVDAHDGDNRRRAPNKAVRVLGGLCRRRRAAVADVVAAAGARPGGDGDRCRGRDQREPV